MMSQLAGFFKGSDTHFGVFYPRHYLLAVFPDSARAHEARTKLQRSGFADDDVIAVSGEDVVEFADEYLKKHGLWTMLMTELSRLIDTEAAYADHDLELARHGAGFLAVHCPRAAVKKSAWRLIEPMRPLAARYYGTTNVEHFAGEY
jgi:hypothetical protein